MCVNVVSRMEVRGGEDGEILERHNLGLASLGDYSASLPFFVMARAEDDDSPSSRLCAEQGSIH